MKYRKSIFITAFSICTISTSYAQPFPIEYSSPIDEIHSAANKVFQTGNGNTFLLCFTKKDGITAMIYNPVRKLAATETYLGKEWDHEDMTDGQVNAIFEVNGKLNVFLQQITKRVPKLYRLTYDISSGKVIEEKKIGEISPYPAMYEMRIRAGKIEEKEFDVVKDPESDYYAVITYNGGEEQKDMLKVEHYDSNNQIINTGIFGIADDKYKQGKYNAAYVMGDKGVYISSYVYNTSKGFRQNDETIMAESVFSRLVKGSSTFSHITYQLIKDESRSYTSILKESDNNLRLFSFVTNWLPYTNIIVMGQKTPERIRRLCSTSVNIAGDLKIGNSDTLSFAPLKRLSKPIDKFYFRPQNFVQNIDRSYSYIMEESSAEFMNGTHLYHIEDAGIIEQGKTGTNKYVIEKGASVKGDLPEFYQKKSDLGAVRFFQADIGMRAFANMGYFSYTYLSTPKGNFVINNDYDKNFDRPADKSPKWVFQADETNAIGYKLENGKMKKFYLFGEPGKDKHRFCYLAAGNYNTATNKFAVLIMDDYDGDKQMRMSWIDFK